MIAIKILQAAEKAAGRWPSHLPGHVNFGDAAIDVEGQLEDGAHRLEGSPWQFIVEAGKIVTAVREDMTAWWRADHMVYGVEEAGEQGKDAPAARSALKPGEQEPGTAAG